MLVQSKSIKVCRISITDKPRLVTTEGNLNAAAAIPYLQSLEDNPILQEDSARLHRASGFNISPNHTNIITG